MRKNRFKNIVKYSGIILIVGILFISILVFGSYEIVSKSTQHQTTNNIHEIPEMPVALVLGTSKYVVGGGINLYFKYRMEAVKELFDHGKIEFIIVSGDNSILEYNETRDMKNYLIQLGVPEEKIIEDFAGFSTLDSVIRAKEVFGQDSVLIVSQEFHNERAVFIANHHNLSSVAYNAKEVPLRNSKKVKIREYFARVKCLMDVYVLNRMPKYYKEKESILGFN